MNKILLKNLSIILVFLGLFVTSCTADRKSEKLFYYGTTEKIPLSVSNNKIILKYSTKADIKNTISKLEKYGKAEMLYGQIFSVMLRDSTMKSDLIESLKKENEVLSANYVYLTEDKQEMGVTDEICLEFNKNVKENERQDLLKSFNAFEISRIQPWEKFYSIITVGKDKDVLTIANKIKETGLVKFAHPNFIVKMEMAQHIPNDNYFPMQFYLNNFGQLINDGHTGSPDADIDAPEAWDITLGNNNITVAVLDEGVELTNNDLPAARLVVLNGSNFVPGSNTNNPDANGNGAHGTCCAGIIASEQGNTQGTAGIAPLCRIMPVRIPFGNFATSIYADAINFAWNNGADILSNSWGGGSNDFPVITAAINNAITQGRNGIGSVVVISAGNTADHNTGINGFVTYPGNVAVADVITVGASDRYDRQANYSPTGNAVDVVAPSHRAYSSQIVGESWEVWSTDITGNDGYNSRKNTDGGTLPPIGEILPSTGTNNLDYTGRMGGTSAACPEVAGVAALLLSVNSNLTPAQVFNIITNSADKVGGYNYTGGRCNQMGFGRLNAFNALSTQLWMKDTPNDPGTEPNPTSDPMYISEDIWARKTNDGITIHENPEYRNPSSGYPNSIYVRVRNAGNVPGSATLILYWAKASSGLGWPAPWDGSVTTPALMGAQIGTITTGMIPSYGESILRFDWYPPSPNDYVTFGSDQFHFCLLARLETSSTAPFGMTIPETGNLYSNVKNNNNIVWKNIIVKDDILEKRASAGLVIANYSKRDELTRIEIKLDADLPWIRYGDLTITLDPRLFRKWQEKGGKGEGFILEGEKLKLTSANVWFGDFTLKPKDIYGMLMQYTMVKKPDVKKLEDYILIIDVKQQVFKVQGKLKEVKGGVRYQLNLSRKTK